MGVGPALCMYTTPSLPSGSRGGRGEHLAGEAASWALHRWSLASQSSRSHPASPWGLRSDLGVGLPDLQPSPAQRTQAGSRTCGLTSETEALEHPNQESTLLSRVCVCMWGCTERRPCLSTAPRTQSHPVSICQRTGMCICIAESPPSTAEIITTLYTNYTSINLEKQTKKPKPPSLWFVQSPEAKSTNPSGVGAGEEKATLLSPLAASTYCVQGWSLRGFLDRPGSKKGQL